MWCKVCLLSTINLMLISVMAGCAGLRYVGVFPDASEDIAQNEQSADAIVVMGGEGGRYTRTEHAIELYNRGLAPIVVFSGGTLLSAGIACTSTELSVGAAERLGLPAEAVLLAGEAQSTWDEVNNLANLAEERDWYSLILVTDRFHTRRALRTLQSVMPNLSITASAPADSRYEARRWWDNEHSLVFVMNELLKLGFYWKEYGIRPFS